MRVTLSCPSCVYEQVNEHGGYGPFVRCPYDNEWLTITEEHPSGAELIAAERKRQVTDERWFASHDDQHPDGSLTWAGIVYAAHAVAFTGDDQLDHLWPWEQKWYKPSDDPVRDLVKAGALIAAEIDRIQREREASVLAPESAIDADGFPAPSTEEETTSDE